MQIEAIPHRLTWENKPKDFTIGKNINPGSWRKTDMFRDPNVSYNTDNAQNYFLKQARTFVLTASIEHDLQ